MTVVSSDSLSRDDMMAVQASRCLSDGAVCFVGVGLPGLAANIARLTHAPHCVLVYESGTIGAKPRRLPLSIGDGELAETADSVVSVPEIFSYWLQGGRIDAAFLGAAQIDPAGNLNTTVIGEYGRPQVRLPGGGGAPEIAASVRDVFVVMRHSLRAFVEHLDFKTSSGERVRAVVTDLGLLEPRTGELTLTQIYHDVTPDEVRAATGWNLKVAPDLREASQPTAAELVALEALRPSAKAATANLRTEVNRPATPALVASVQVTLPSDEVGINLLSPGGS